MASVPNPSLDIGLDALKQGNYTEAIAHLEGVREVELDESIVSRAAIALVTAYRRGGNVQQAIALCQQLTEDANPKVKKWADNTLAKLIAESPTSLPQSNLTGFVPLEDAPPTASTSDSTGFVPLNPTPPANPSPIKERLTNSTKRLFSGGNKPQPERAATHPSPSTSQLPVPYSPASTPSRFGDRPRLRNRGRAEGWRPLKSPSLRRLWLIEIGTGIAFFWLLRFWVQFLMGTTNYILVKLPLLQPIQLFYRNPTPTLAVTLLILFILSPWLIDLGLRQFHGLKRLSLTQLASRTPEAAKVLQRFCRERRLPIPTLGILPTDAPVAMTYGNLPRTARIVISEGLLAQLSHEEIATIYATQLGHIAYRDFMGMSLGTLAIQIPYILYWQVARWGERLADLSKLPLLSPILLGITSVICAISYGTYWLLRLPLLWLSRVRIYYSDRIAIETTGNPNGLTRALVKIGLGIPEAIQTDSQTSRLLESFDLLLPVGYRQALPLSSCSPQISFESILHWDCTNPYRHWLIVTASHPLIGDRLHLCTRYAHLWTLGTELDLPIPTPPAPTKAALLSKLQNSPKALPLLQSALLAGLALGLLLRAILWFIGIVSDGLDIWRLIWLHNASPFLDACILVAFSLSIFIWINRYFPDIKPATVRTQPNLGELLANPDTLPPDSLPVELTGKLLGRRGLLNRLGQDLILQTSTGLVKLHFMSYLGSLGNLLPLSTHPSHLIGEQVTLTGWFRRGATPWIDVETLRTQSGKISRAHFPIFLVILALAAAFWGAYLIWLA
ncbi:MULTISPECIES: zinc metalloprotease HtpX [unclassified Coleofasciculus]|uniref:zinc metalloprotease HtpX n=1 Tax=unclassified Coleofasciculus TaxID=2692782 RepID=UPI0018801C61|nr:MULTISPECIES: zinc metalloprotease HtpX [unclassified Coleofasciculus]MBE9128174.1 M48 family metalloprotease [Coleofasciculus sp. LEGE 07081]MBE9149725.1 M48 family metalloprotease [Coleofasciculus sp. LEGE 07092]